MAGLWVRRVVSTISWQRFGESDLGMFDLEVLGGWIRGQDVEAFFKDLFESVETQIISSGEGKVMVVTGGMGGGVGIPLWNEF